jgi:hypothetical protein
LTNQAWFEAVFSGCCVPLSELLSGFTLADATDLSGGGFCVLSATGCNALFPVAGFVAASVGAGFGVLSFCRPSP